MFNDSFKELEKSKVSVSEILSFYNVQLGTVKGRTKWYYCFRHSETKPSLAVIDDEQRAYCYSCRRREDIFSITMYFEHCDFAEAMIKIAENWGIPIPESKDEDPNRQAYFDAMNFLTNSFHDCLSLYDNEGYHYWYDRGFDKKFIDDHKLGVCYPPKKNGALLSILKHRFGDLPYNALGIVDKQGNFPLVERMIIPVCNKQGKVVSFTGRTINNSFAKYKHMINNTYYTNSNNLFMFNKAKYANDIIIVEGHMDALSLHAAGYDNAVALAGCNLSEYQKIQLTGKRIILSLDNDRAGINSTLEILKRYPKENIYVCRYPEGTKDYNDLLMAKQEIKLDIISDAEFLATQALNESNGYLAVDKVIDYLSLKYKACKEFDNSLKVGANMLGINNAINIIKNGFNIELDVENILDRVYG